MTTLTSVGLTSGVSDATGPSGGTGTVSSLDNFTTASIPTTGDNALTFQLSPKGILSAGTAASTSSNPVVGAYDTVWRQSLRNNSTNNNVKFRTTATVTTTVETAIVSPQSGYFADPYVCLVTNTSASNVSISIQDSSGGSNTFTIPVPSMDMRGFVMPAGDAITQTSSGKAWTAFTTTTGVIISYLTMAVKST